MLFGVRWRRRQRLAGSRRQLTPPPAAVGTPDGPQPPIQDSGRSGAAGCSARSAGVPRGERFGPYLIHVVTPRRLAPDDPPGALDGVRVVDALAALADPVYGGSARLEVAGAVGLEDSDAPAGGVGKIAAPAPRAASRPGRTLPPCRAAELSPIWPSPRVAPGQTGATYFRHSIR